MYVQNYIVINMTGTRLLAKFIRGIKNGNEIDIHLNT